MLYVRVQVVDEVGRRAPSGSYSYGVCRVGSGIPTTSIRQPAAPGTKTPVAGIKKPTTGAGLGGKYADVKSSGYGPARKAI